MGRRASSIAIVTSLVVAGCAGSGASVEVLQARPNDAPDSPVTTGGRLRPAPELSLPVVPTTGSTEAPASTAASAPTGTDSPVPGDGTTQVAVTPLKFGWTVPCAVPATEMREFAATTANVKYVVRLEADPETNGLVMRQTDVQVVDVDGKAPAATDVDLVTLGMRVPDVLVGFDGVETGVRGAPELLDEMIATGVLGTDPMTDAERQDAITGLESNASLKYWSTWVGGWAGLGRVPTAATNKGGIRLEALPTPEAGRVRLRYSEDLTGTGLAEAVGVTVENGGDPTLYDKVRRVNVIEAVTDPATLRPDWASFSIDVTGTIANEPADLHEVHTVRFDWASSTGCGVG